MLKDKNGKAITAGCTIMCVNDVRYGDTTTVYEQNGTLMLSDCHNPRNRAPLADMPQLNGCMRDFVLV